MNRLPALIFAACSLVLLGGCEAVIAGVASPMILQQKKVNLLNASYAAADTVSVQAGKSFAPPAVLVVENLKEIPSKNNKTVTLSPRVGEVLSHQYHDRFLQLGYNVSGEGINRNSPNRGTLTGTYEFINNRMDVAMMLRDVKSGRVITTHHYSLPITYDIKKYMTQDANSLPALPPLF